MLKKEIIFLSMLLLIIIFFYDILFLDKTLSTTSLMPGITQVKSNQQIKPFSFDLSGNAWINEPYPYIIKRIIKDGSLPLWNPYEGLGMPLLANPNSEVLNPLKIPLNLFPSAYLQDIFYLLRLLMIGVFTAFFLREFGLSLISSIAGGAGFMLSGYTIWWINLHPLSSLAYIPGVFYFYEKALNKKSQRYTAFTFMAALLLAFAIFGGKIPVVLMGVLLLSLYSAYLSIKRHSFQPLKLFLLIILSGFALSSVLLIPFFELFENASIIAKSVRSGASSHTIPFKSSITLWQPLFLGLKNYFYNSWIKWHPPVMMPYIGIIMLLLNIYLFLKKNLLKKVLPFVIFSTLIFLKVYGILPENIFIGIPFLESINFLKYNGMFYFCLAIAGATSLESLKQDNDNKFILAILFVSLIIAGYYLLLFNDYINSNAKKFQLIFGVTEVFICIIMLFSLLMIKSKKGKELSFLITLLMIIELFVYMPKKHPIRTEPFKENKLINILKNDKPYRMIADGLTIPPLTSNAVGLFDIRGIDVLIPRDYYNAFQNKISFSVPYTNNPDIVVSATSKFIDLVGVKYIITKEKIDFSNLKNRLYNNLTGLRTIKFFNSMKKHWIKGGSTLEYFEKQGEKRFSLIFPGKFNFTSFVFIESPFLFTGLTVDKYSSSVKLNIAGKVFKIHIIDKIWNDQFFSLKDFSGKLVKISLYSKGNPENKVVLGGFGFTMGKEAEKKWLDDKYKKHLKESSKIVLYDNINGVFIYKNKNVMPRAFVINDLNVLNNLEEQLNLKKYKKAVITKYKPNKVEIKTKGKGGLLILTDIYYPGWKVKVNGKRTELIKVSGLLRGIVISEGYNNIIFYYRPYSVYIGVIITFLSILCIVFLVNRSSLK